uniref:NADH-ubiquinone oxidoreductase chain 4 n=1 Tax=Apatides fortis TaxID=590156 RepID=D1G5P3_APAFO|nr:NADH dehydrogenase subunit 4 [Apatides fortis]ACM45058.1 NADH dehydrogenase subunit 4 [Apatides fortis]
MMGLLMSMVFMIPLSIYGEFWVNAVIIFLLSFICIFSFSYDYLFMYVSYDFGVDLLSYLMVLLSFWICGLMLLASSKINLFSNYDKFFQFTVLLLLFSLVVAFSSLNFFLFYIFFEVSLIPTLMLIVGWGYQPERLQAGIYLLFYTMLASLPMLISLFYYYSFFDSLAMSYLEGDFSSILYFLFFTMVFFVKIPMFMLHLWLPKAHVEAPVSGSMILAGIMLKLGGYGLMRVLVMFIGLGLEISSFFMSVALLGGVYVSLICLRQSDMKSLIAYSSVAHMGMVICGLFTFTIWGMVGSLGMMVAHGLCSSGLFCLANISYERLGSRSLLVNKGLINLAPSMSLCWFLLSSSNMAAPPSFNLLSEIALLSSVVSWSSLTMGVLFFLSFFSAAYTLFLYSYTQHGIFFKGVYSTNMGYVREYLLLILHWLPLNLLFLKSSYFCLWV